MRRGRGQRLGLVGMRAALLLVLLAGCQTIRFAPRQRLVEEARAALETERFKDGLRAVERALEGAPQGSDEYFRARLLKAELQLASREARAALATLDFDIPPEPRWNLERGRQSLLQGHAHLLLGDREPASENLERADQLARLASSSLLAAEVRLRKGSLLVRAGDFEQAGVNFRGALDFAERQGHTPLRLSATGNLGFLDLRAHRYEDAIEWFDRTLALARATGARVSEARAQGNLGSAYYRLGDYERALECFSSAERSFAALGNRFEQQIWRGNQGNVQLDLREFAQAKASYSEALSMARSLDNSVWIATWLSDLAQTAIGAQDWDAADRYNRQALQLKQKLKDPQAVAFSLNNLARIAVGRGQYAKGREIFARVIASSSDPVTVLEAHTGLAESYIAAGDAARAEPALRSALAVAGEQRSRLERDESKLSYFSKLIGLYQEYVEFLMSRERVEEALLVADTSRARILSGRFQQPHSGKPLRAADLKRAAGMRGEVFLSYWLSGKRSFVWVVTKDAISAVPLPPESQVRRAVMAYNDVIQAQRDPLESRHPAGVRLSEMLWQPVQDLIPAESRITIVPDGPLHALNFEALPRPGSSPPTYLGEDLTFAVTPWLGSLAAAGAVRALPEEGAVLVMGNPLPGGTFARLAHAEDEMSAVQESLSGRTQVTLRGERASAAAYLEAAPGRFSLIHFAAHAAANRDSPLESAIILSEPASRLTARQIMAAPLTAGLVTVSSCRSGGARIYAGEGMVGLSWAFLRAGAGNVIASLWNVGDHSTALLMTRLYRELSRGARPADALHAAKLALIRGAGPYRKPYYWAPFQIYTSGRRPGLQPDLRSDRSFSKGSTAGSGR